MKFILLIAILASFGGSAWAVEADTDCPYINQEQEGRKVSSDQPVKEKKPKSTAVGM